MENQKENKKICDLGNGLELWELEISTLKERDINAQVMDDRRMKILTANIKQRGALESLPLVHKKGDTFTIISGHHRVRAANAAGLSKIYALVDTEELTESQLTSKQIAHNELVGHADSEILAQLVKQMQDIDDLISSGLDEQYFNKVLSSSPVLDLPQLEFDWRLIQFTFLPKSVKGLEQLVQSIENKAEFVGVAKVEQFENFVRACNKVGKIKNIKSIGATIQYLINVAQKEIERNGTEKQV